MMRLDCGFTSLGFIGLLALSANVPLGTYALPVRAADLRQPVEGMLLARRPTYAEAGSTRDLPLVKRSRPVERGYYVGPTDAASSAGMAKRDRFAPIGYPVRGLARRGGDDDVKDAGAAVADRKSTDVGAHPPVPDSSHPAAPDSSHPPPPAAPNADSKTDDKPAAGADGDKGSIKLPPDVKISSPGFIFIPVESGKTAAAGNSGDGGKVSATQSTSHQTYFINVEAPVVSGPTADDAKDDKDKKKDDAKASDPKSAGTDHDQTKIIFKPLKDSDGKSDDGSGGGGGAPKAQPDSSSNPHPPPSTNRDATGASNTKPATDSKSSDGSTTPAAAAPAPAAPAASSQSAKAGGDDDYYLFPVTQEHEQVDLSKGDMIAYVDHPNAPAKTAPPAPAVAAPPSTPPGPASAPSSTPPPAAPAPAASSPSNAPNAAGGPPPVPAASVPDPNSSSKRRDVADDGSPTSFRRMIKRALVPGERDARIGYWTGQELNRKRFDASAASAMIGRTR